MTDYAQPTSADLLAAVARFLEETAAPELSGRAAFLAKVAANAVGVVRRELTDGAAASARESAAWRALGFDGDLPEQRAALCAAIRHGAMEVATPGLLDAVLAATADRVRIEQPGYTSLSRAP